MNDLPKENIYGHVNRLTWMKKYLSENNTFMELGCGTGYMITYPLRYHGYNIEGFDLDTKSIGYGRKFFCAQDDIFLHTLDIRAIKKRYDVIIASEVFEHMALDMLDEAVETIWESLNPGGIVLVTVPNGYGWFEFESFLWNKLGWGRLLEQLRGISAVQKLKRLLCGEYIDALHPSTLSTSPHVRRFSFQSIQNKLMQKGFEIIEAKGSVLFCGPFSNTVFTGIRPIMRVNIWLGSKLAKIAAGFYIAARKSDA